MSELKASLFNIFLFVYLIYTPRGIQNRTYVQVYWGKVP